MPEEVRSCKEWGRKDSEKHTRRPWLKKDPNSTLCFHAIIADAILLLSPNASCLEQGECVCAQLLSRVQLFATPWTRACQALLSEGFSRQEYWSELPFPPQGRGFSRPRKPTHVSGIGRRILKTEPSGKPMEQEVASVKESIQMTYSNCFWHLCPQSFNLFNGIRES